MLLHSAVRFAKSSPTRGSADEEMRNVRITKKQKCSGSPKRFSRLMLWDAATARIKQSLKPNARPPHVTTSRRGVPGGQA
eukprot:2924539-Amphidinium_carterae.1